jgi:uncharacterized Rossmann fold enzyme
MEHVAPETVEDVLMNIATATKKAVFFSISLVADYFGPVMLGKPLHLTIEDADWWKKKLNRIWPRVEIVSETKSTLTAVCFTSGPVRFREDVRIDTLCNTPDKVIDQYMIENAKRKLPWVSIECVHPFDAVIVGGGPSLARTIETVRAQCNAGHTIFALNNAANYLAHNGIRPNWQIVVDSRRDNLRFVEKHPASGYILSAQCHPALFSFMVGENVKIFYPATHNIRKLIPEIDAAPLVGGMHTSGLQAMAVAYMLGHRTLHLHGYDSSDADNGETHAYEQTKNAADLKRLSVLFNGKTYQCSYAMFKQAESFEWFSRMMANNDAIIHVYGDGLLPAIAHDIAVKNSPVERAAS